MNIFEQGAGMLIGDEIAQSSNPGQHARDLVANLVANNFRYACLQQLPINELAAPLLRDACKASGKIAFTSWEQNRPPLEQIEIAIRWQVEGHLPNVESYSEDQQWQDIQLDMLSAAVRGNCGVIFTEGAWGRDKAKSRRWIVRGFTGIPEAIESENPQASINAMLDLALQLGWAPEATSTLIYLTRGYPSTGYTDEINSTAGRWGIFRYGDVDDRDWSEFTKWPRVKIQMPLPGMAVEDAHKAIIAILDEANKRQVALGRQPLGEASALVNAADSSRAALNKAWNPAIGQRFAALRLELGI